MKSESFITENILNFKILLYSSFNILSTLIQTYLITKVLNQNDYGEYAYLVSLTHVIMILSQWGFTNWGVTQLNKTAKNEKGYLIGSIITAKIFLGLVTLLVVLTYYFVHADPLSNLVVIGFILFYIGYAINSDFAYIKSENILKLTSKNSLVKCINLLVIFFATTINKINSEIIFLLVCSQTSFYGFLLFFSKEFKVRNQIKFNFNLGVIKKSFGNFHLTLASFLFASGPLLLSGHYLDKFYFTPIYAAFAVVKMLQASYTPIIQRFLPKLYLNKSIKSELLFSTIFCFSGTILIYFLAPLIVKFVYSDYEDIVYSLRLFSLSILPGIASTIIISQISVFKSKVVETYFLIYTVACLLNLTIIAMKSSLTWEFILTSMVISEYLLLIALLVLFLKDFKSIAKNNYDQIGQAIL